ncbi:SHOCT domain-containing protein [Rhodococcus aetherivorans]
MACHRDQRLLPHRTPLRAADRAPPHPAPHGRTLGWPAHRTRRHIRQHRTAHSHCPYAPGRIVRAGRAHGGRSIWPSRKGICGDALRKLRLGNERRLGDVAVRRAAAARPGGPGGAGDPVALPTVRFRRPLRRPQQHLPPPPGEGRARQILEERYARGEIDSEEYRERRRVLDGHD